MTQTGITEPPPRPRVLLVSITPFFGGGESYLLKLAELLGTRYALRAVVREPRLAAGLLASGVPTELLRTAKRGMSKRYWGMARLLRRTCKSWQPDMIHLNGQGECHLIPALLPLQRPVIAIRHTPLRSSLVLPALRPLVKLEYRFISSIVCVSEILRADLQREGIPARKLRAIPNWVESRRIADRVSGQGSKDPFRIAMVGRLHPLKGPMDAVLALKHLPGTVLDIVGDGPQRAELEAAAKQLPVFFHGFQQDCTPFYEAADLLLFPSYNNVEGHPQVPLEAMARGTACLLSNIDVSLEISDNGRCAALFRCGDPEDLARQVRALQNDPERLQELRVAGLERVKEAYSESAVRDRYLGLYESVMQQQTAKRAGRS